MNIEDLQKAPKYGGVYFFKNKINGKYYIGQSVTIRKRLLKHVSNLGKDRYNAPIYKAFKKYGLENFEYGILDSFKTGLTKEELKVELDRLEIKYIAEYNSYVNSGYNQTLGGDAGITGYEFTKEQVDKVIDNSKLTQNDGRNIIYIYDIVDKVYYTFISSRYSESVLKVPGRFKVSSGINYCRYIVARTKEDLESKISIYKHNLHNNIIGGRYKSKLTVTMSEDIDKGMNYKEFTIKHNVCKKTYYNYKN